MRVLVADSDSEALEAIGRAFEVDVAASKVTCIDLLRANDYDVLVAAERLDDGSGLELLSQVAKRWPDVVRILAIEPARRAMLRGKLAPFKLFDTIAYPVDESQLESALQHAADFCEPGEPRARLPMSSRVAASRPNPPPSSAAMTGRGGSVPRALDRNVSVPAPSTDAAAAASTSHSARLNAYRARAAATSAAPPVRQRELAKPDSPPPLPSRAAMRDYVPLGAPEQGQVRIVQRDYDNSDDPLLARVQRNEEKAASTLPAKAAALAAAVSAAVTRYIKPEPEPEPEPPTPLRRRRR
jgi:DNA-binding NarL/FixJ family response regulator